MSLNFYKQVKNYIALFVMILFSTTLLYAQPMAGTFTIDPAGSGATNFTTFQAAIDSLNAKGVGTGGVTFNVAAGATFAETGALVLTATGTSANPIIFQKSGTGANPVINPAFGSIATQTGSTYGAAGDVILKIVGSDYVTIDGINFIEPAGRSSVALTEYGIAILKGSATDGSRNITIKNCTIELNRATRLSTGIFAANYTQALGSSLTVTAISGRNENIYVLNNTVNNTWTAMYFQTSFSSTLDLFDNNIVVRNNTITNYSGGNTTSYGLYMLYTDSIDVTNNTLSNATGHTSTLYGIMLSSGTNGKVKIDSNTVNLVSSATTSATYAIYNGIGSSGTDNYIYIRGNKVSHNSTTNTSATVAGIYNFGSAFNVDISNNTVRNTSVGTTTSNYTGTYYGIYNSATNSNAGSITNIYNNTVRDFTRLQTTTGSTGTFYGMAVFGTGQTNNVYGNKIANISNTTTTSSVWGIYTSNNVPTKNIYNNIVDSFVVSGGTTIGITNTTGTLVNIYGNTVRGLNANKNASSVAIGIQNTGGTDVNVYNNFISDLRAPLSTNANAVTGLSLTGGTNVNVDHNTVYLNATSSGTGFGSTALTFGTSPTKLVVRNNILYNVSTRTGTSRTAVIRRTAVGTTNYNTASNNNLLYAGANSVIYFDGTNADTTLAQFKKRVASGESLSLTGTLDFVNSTTTPFDLHINTSIATLVESAGLPISNITTDFDGNARNANNPDIGADEGAFIAGADVQGPIISYTTLNNTGSISNRTIVVNISDRTSVNTSAGTSPRLYFKKTTDANTYIANTNTNNGWKYVESTSTTNPFSFTIDYSLFNTLVAAGDTIQYFVIAQDGSTPSNVSVNSVILNSSASTVDLTSANFPASGTINNYRILPQVSTLVTIGSGGTYPSLSGVGGFFEAVNNSVVTSNVTAQVISHLDETGAVGLNQFIEEGAGAGTYRITIVPSSAVEDSIRGSFVGGLIRLNSADRVTFDGSFAGSGKYFVFANKSTSNSVANIQLIDNGGSVNGCENIIIKNSIFIGLTTTAQSNSNFGISVGGSVGATGRNHHNLTIDSNEFKGLKFGIYATGIAGAEFQNLKITNNVIGNLDQRMRDKGIVVGYVNRARIFNNTLFAFQTISTSVSTSLAAMQINVGTTNSMIDRNNIYDIAFTGTGGYDARGISVLSSTLTNNDTIYANTISWVRNDGWSSLFDGAVGIAIEGGDRMHVYNNSINMFGNLTTTTRTSSTQTAGIWVNGGTNINVKNNLVYNTLKNPNATGAPLMESYGIYITGTAGAGGAIASLDNNNYATDAATSTWVSNVNSVKYRTLLDHQLATNRDKNSFAEVPAFVDSINLRINSGTVGTLLESHGQNIVGVNRDIDNQVRPGPVGSVNGGALTFDIGADEFDGVYLADIFPPTILVDSVSPAVNNCRPVAHTVYARITDLSGIDTAEIRYSVNGVAQPTFLMTALGSGRYSGTIPAQIPGAQVILSIYAQDSLNNSITKGVDTFIDARFNFTVTASDDTVAAGNTFQLDALLPSTVKQIGTGTLRTTFVPNPYYTGWWGNKGQHLITAAELTAQGFVAGNITSLGLNVTTSSALPMNNFTIRMASTNLTNLTSSFVITGFSQVFTTPVLNLVANSFNNHVFQTPFYWDGVSNIIIETCFNNTQYAGTASVEYTTTNFVSNIYYYADALGVCAVGSGTTSNNRPNFILGQPLTATYTWSSSANGGLQSTNIRNPLATPSGGAGLYSYILTASDGTCSWTDTVDVRVVAAVTPLASFRTDTTIAVSGNTPTEVSVINSATNFPNTWKYSITPANFQFIKGTNANSKAPKFIFNRAGQYTIKQVVTNAAGSDSLVRANYITVTLDYCRPTVSSTFQYTHINSFKLKALTNTSGQTTGAYNNYTDSTGFVIPQLEAGRTDTITFRLGAGTFNSNNTTTAWIDYNQDGAFTNDEILGNAFGVPAINTDANIIFKAPYTALAGPTRLRIRNSAFAAANSPLPACGSTFYGETEDYTVNISPAPLMAVQAVKLEQDTVAVLPGTSNALVLGTKVIVTGYTNRLSATSINVSTAGTTSLSNIGAVRVYYTANNPVFDMNNLFASGTPAANLTLTGNVLLEGDTNYFWLVYDVDSFATIGNTLDAQISSVTIGGAPYTPLNTNPAGNKKILLQAVPTSLAGYQPFNTIPVYPNSNDNPVIAAKITMSNGVISTIDRLTLALTNTKLGILSSARLVYTGNDSTYTSQNKVQFGANPLSFAGNIVFADTMQLMTGDNYFWLTTDVNTSALIGDTLDAVFSSARIQGNTVNATVVAPAGVRKVEAFPITCNSIPTSNVDEDIARVQIGNFVNQSASTQIASNPESNKTYSNFASLQGMTMQVEVPINYQVNVINSGSNLYTSTLNIFIDVNKNGVFDLPRERYVKRLVPNTANARTPSGTVKLPIGTQGGKTIMRVMLIETSNAADTLNPCNQSYTWGEIEDYSVNILPAPPGDYYAPIITNVVLTPDSQCVSTSHTITANITDTTGIDSVWINWSADGIDQTPIMMANTSGSTYSGTIPAQGRSVVRYSITAQDNSPRANENRTNTDVYRDEYLKAVFNAGLDGYIPVGGTHPFDAAVKRQPTFGNGSFLSPVYNFYRLFGGQKVQYIFTAAELSAKGLSAGQITALAWSTGPVQSIDTMRNYSVSVANTTINDLTPGFVMTGLTEVIPTIPTYIPGAGGYANATQNFVTPFVWDGVSNIVVQILWNNNDAGTPSSATNARTYYTSGYPTGTTRYFYGDNLPTSDFVTSVTGGFTTTIRPDMMLKQGLPYTYSWTQSTNGGLSATNIANPTATPTGGAGTYTYVATVGDGVCTANDTVLVNVLAAPTVDLGATTATICGTAPTVLSSTTTAGSSVSYAWTYDGLPMQGVNTASHAAVNAGVYKVTVTDLAGQTASDSVTVSTAPAFVYNNFADTLQVCIGGTRVLDAGANYGSYLWSTGATTRTISVSTAGVYTVTVTNAGGCASTDTFETVLVNPTAVNIGTDQAICESSPLTLDAGNTGATYLWSTGATTKTIQVTKAGQYTVLVNTVTGCTLTDTINITNLPAPTVSLGADQELCSGASLTLDAGNAGSTFAWSTGATTQTILVNTTGTFWVDVTGTNGCISRDSIVVSPKLSPVVNLGADRDICSSDSITLDAGNVGSTYLWSTGATTQTIKVSLAGTYSVAVTNVGGCTTTDAMIVTNKPTPNSAFTSQAVSAEAGQQIQFTSTPAAGNQYSWNFGDPNSASNTSLLPSPIHVFSAPGQYTVTLTVTNVSTGCKSVTTSTITVTTVGNDFAKIFNLFAAPNPFVGNTKIKYTLPENANSVSIDVYDMIGRKVSTIATNESQDAGTYEFNFENTDTENASGVYMVKLIVDGKVAITRVIDIAKR